MPSRVFVMQILQVLYKKYLAINKYINITFLINYYYFRLYYNGIMIRRDDCKLQIE